MMGWEIKQIIPAPGWQVVYATKGKDGAWYAKAYPLAAWALVGAEGGFQRVVGLAGGDFIDFVEEGTDFLVYLGPGEDVSLWHKRAEEYGQSEDALKASKEQKSA